MAIYLTRVEFIDWTRQCMLDGGLEPLTPDQAEQDWQNWLKGMVHVMVPMPVTAE